jgi:hypothetical protein
VRESCSSVKRRRGRLEQKLSVRSEREGVGSRVGGNKDCDAMRRNAVDARTQRGYDTEKDNKDGIRTMLLWYAVPMVVCLYKDESTCLQLHNYFEIWKSLWRRGCRKRRFTRPAGVMLLTKR